MTKLFRNCAYVSAVFFVGFVSLYSYVWIADPNPQVSESGIHWSYISIGRSTKALTGTNGLTTGTYVYDGGRSLHFTVTKEHGGNLIVFNQNMPFEGVMLAFASKNRTNETRLVGCGIHFISFKHSVALVGFTNDDRASEVYLMGYGIYFSHITHTLEKDKNWWTLMISLWYPLIILSILPFALVIKKLTTAKVNSSEAKK